MPATTLDPRTALVVIDLQRGIVGHPVQPHSAADTVARSAELATAFRKRGLPVVLVNVDFSADGGDVPPGLAAFAGLLSARDMHAASVRREAVRSVVDETRRVVCTAASRSTSVCWAVSWDCICC